MDAAYLDGVGCGDECGCDEFRLPLNVLPRVEGGCEEAGREEDFSLERGRKDGCTKR